MIITKKILAIYMKLQLQHYLHGNSMIQKIVNEQGFWDLFKLNIKDSMNTIQYINRA